MDDITTFASNLKEKQVLTLFKGIRKALKAGDLEVLGRAADIRRMLNNSLTVANLDPGNHLLGVTIDWNGNRADLRIPPGGQQRIENFSFLTAYFIRLQVDPPVRLTNNGNYVCFYQVTKLLTNGQNIQQQFINPWPGASEIYSLNIGDRLIVVPNSMAQYILTYDFDLKCLQAPKRTQKKASRKATAT